MPTKPLCVDLYAGLGGWAEGFLAEDYDVVGFDNHRHEYWMPLRKLVRYPGQLVIQDVLTLHGSQFRNAAVIVASPPCQNYSYLAMPWSKSPDWWRPDGDGWEQVASPAAKELRRKWEAEGPDNRLFDACFRIQREASEAAGRHIPLIVENVRGAIPWVGRSVWNFGSFHLWGDVPALMPINLKRGMKGNPDGTGHPPGSWVAISDSKNRGAQSDGQKVPGFRFDGSGRSFQSASVEHTAEGRKVPSEDGGRRTDIRKGHAGSWFFRTGENTAGDPRDVRRGADGEYVMPDGTKIGGDWLSDPNSTCRKHASRSAARKAASAQIAKIPFPLSQYLAQVFKPRKDSAAA